LSCPEPNQLRLVGVHLEPIAAHPGLPKLSLKKPLLNGCFLAVTFRNVQTWWTDVVCSRDVHKTEQDQDDDASKTASKPADDNIQVRSLVV